MAEDRPSITIRLMTEQDIPSAMRLSELAGWNQIDTTWRYMLEFEPRGCFVAESNGAVCGTTTTTDFQRRFAWIGMVLVDPSFRRCGIGRSLMNRAIEYLEGLGTETIRLDATPLGKTVYDQLGFVDEYALTRWGGTGRSSAGNQRADASTLPLREEDWEELLALDREAFGADRGAVLKRCLGLAPHTARVLRDAQGRLAGYIGATPGRLAWHVGPCIARDGATAAQLLRAECAILHDQPIFIDVPDSAGEMRAALQEMGFQSQRPLIRMYRGPNNFPGRVELVHAILAPELG